MQKPSQKQPTNTEEYAHRLKMTADRMGRREGMIHQYVDDVVVLARTPEELQHMINDIVGVNSNHAMQNPRDEGMDSSEPETEDDDQKSAGERRNVQEWKADELQQCR